MPATELAPGVFSELTPEQRERGMRTLVYATGLGAVFLFSVYHTPLTMFAVQLGAGAVLLGLLAGIVRGSMIVQVLLAREVEVHGKKRLLIPAWVVTAVCAVPLVLIPWLPADPGLRFGVLIATVAVISITRQLGWVSWMPLMSDVVPEEKRGRFFGRMRTAWQATALILTVAIAALFSERPALWQFQIVFAVGILSVAIRVPVLRRIPELAPHPSATERSRLDFVGDALRDRSFAAFLLMTGSFHFMSQAMRPHSVAYMNNVLGYGANYVIIARQGVGFAGAILTLILWGRLADRIGTRVIFVVTMVGTALTTLVWLFVVPGSVAAQVALTVCLFLRGLLLAGFGIASSRYLYGVLPEGNKSGYLTAHTVAMGVGSGLGPFLAGIALRGTGRIGLTLAGLRLDNYQLMFAATVLGIFLALALLPRLKTEDDASVRRVFGLLFYRPFRTALDLFLAPGNGRGGARERHRTPDEHDRKDGTDGDAD